MNVKDLYLLFDELANSTQQDNILRQIHDALPSSINDELLIYLNENHSIRELLTEQYLRNCRYMIRLFNYNSQEFIFEEYARMARVSNNLFRLENLLRHEEVFGEFKTALSAALKNKNFRSCFRQEYFSLSATHRSDSLETLL